MKSKIVASEETQQEAMKIAKATQKPGQTKEQTRLVAQGIEKGIALYKKQQKEKNRKADKAKKKVQKEKAAATKPAMEPVEQVRETKPQSPSKLPWILLVCSWTLFAAYVVAMK
ncbi:DUF2956 domain-containing protein [Vibrio marisflavi]|uniref:DUF2956 domain-containing protein n=1 Tax=Vibrio marisflavi CECT 7928 TaxID=634439 RepID=A0ABN8E4K9_9VIBR|nr:DUF2956 domain-containing protein [Vibrio marisflavi]CAH0539067.1 hypothetical protein VMF7928_01867 [Vibrio marisflavi CECT 7928]